MQCCWEAPDGSHEVSLTCTTLEELREHTLQAFLSLPKRGTEIGGLLLGRTEGQKVRIDTFEEVPCEHRFGPSYIFSDTDRETLKKRLKRKLEGSLDVVGFYRSYTHREAELEQADRELLDTFFPDEQAVFLLLKPVSAVACEAAFVFRGSGGLPERPPYPAVPFAAATFQRAVSVPEARPAAVKAKVVERVVAEPLMAEEAVIPAATWREPPQRQVAKATAATIDQPVHPAPEEAEAWEVERAVRYEVPPPKFTLPTRRSARAERLAMEPEATLDRPPGPPHSSRRIWLPLATCILASIAAAALYELWTVTRAPLWSDLKLNARQTDSGLLLSWDRAAPAVLVASRGVLTVADGGGRREIELQQQQVRTGAFTYRPSGNDVMFRLQVFGGGRAAGDSLRVMAAAPPVALPTPANAPAEPPAPRRGEAARAESLPESAIAPNAVHQVQPSIPEGIRSRIERTITVPVEVEVNASGHVVRASARGSGDGLYRYLAREAAKAARQWRFAPVKGKRTARRTIPFVFRPAQG